MSDNRCRYTEIRDTLRTLGQGALGSLTFGIYWYIVTKRMIDEQNIKRHEYHMPQVHTMDIVDTSNLDRDIEELKKHIEEQDKRIQEQQEQIERLQLKNRRWL